MSVPACTCMRCTNYISITFTGVYNSIVSIKCKQLSVKVTPFLNSVYKRPGNNKQS